MFEAPGGPLKQIDNSKTSKPVRFILRILAAPDMAWANSS